MTITHYKLYILAAVIVSLTLVGSAYAMQPDVGNSFSRSGDGCAHGHNSFDCKPAQFRIDIEELQERVTSLERIHKNSP